MPARVSRAALARIAAALLLSALTLALFAWDGRFEPIDRDIIRNLDFSRGSEGWWATPGVTLAPALGPAAIVTTRPQRPLAYLASDVPDPRRFEFFRLQADVKLEDIVPRALEWQRAGILLRPFDRFDQRVRYWPYVMFERAGSSDWQHVQQVFPVSPDGSRLTLYVYNGGESGRFLVRGLQLDAVAETGLTRLARQTLMVCWAGLVLSTAAAMFVRASNGNRWLLLLLGALILASTLAPQPGLLYMVGDSANRAFSVVDATVARIAQEPPAMTGAARRPPVAIVAPGDAADPQIVPSEAAPAGVGEGSKATAPSDAPAAAPEGPSVTAPEDSATSSEGGPARPPHPSPTAAVRVWLDGILYEGRPVLGLDKQRVSPISRCLPCLPGCWPYRRQASPCCRWPAICCWPRPRPRSCSPSSSAAASNWPT